MMLTISVGRRPKRSAIIPNRIAPTGRMARSENRLRDRRDRGLKLRGQRANAENQNKKIKSVQRPPQKAGNKRIPLQRGQLSEMTNKLHAFLQLMPAPDDSGTGTTSSRAANRL